MNREWVLHNLRHVSEELNRTIAEIEADAEYEMGDFIVAMGHMYLHLNTAWNAQDVDPERVRNCSKEDFDNWRSFPKEFDV